MNKKLIEVVEEKVDDLIIQATKERSHYYTASVLQECKLFLTQYKSILKTLEACEMPKAKELPKGFRPLRTMEESLLKLYNLALQECRPYIASITLRAEKAEKKVEEEQRINALLRDDNKEKRDEITRFKKENEKLQGKITRYDINTMDECEKRCPELKKIRQTLFTMKGKLKDMMPELVEECFPKGECKERGKALLLVGLICARFETQKKL